MNGEKVTDPNYPGYVYAGGPRAGLSVLFEPGWPPPAAIHNVDWPHGRYELESGTKRYVWTTGPDPRESRRLQS